MILGIPQEPNHNISLSQMLTNHNAQSRYIHSGIDYIYFSPTGTSEDTVLYIQDLEGRAVSITVEADSARVRIRNVDPEENGAIGLSTSGSNLN